MRKIKFRAKKIENGKWCYGVPLIFVDGSIHMIDFVKKYTYHTSAVIPETLGQFTGIEDFYKNEICEADICQTWIMGIEQKEPYVVESVGQLHVDMNQADSYFEISRIIRLGNTHDNPELLEVKQ